MNVNSTVDIVAHIRKTYKFLNKNNVTELAVMAFNEFTPTDILYELLKHENDIVRSSLVFNKNCPVDILESLSNDKSVYVKYRLGQSRHLTSKIIRDLLFADIKIVKNSLFFNQIVKKHIKGYIALQNIIEEITQ